MNMEESVAGGECGIPEAIVRLLKKPRAPARFLRAVPTLCLAGVAAVTGLRLLKLPACWPADLLCSFPLQYGIAAIVLCAVLVGLGRPAGAAVSLAVALVNFGMLAPAGGQKEDDAPGQTVQVYAANILCTNRSLERLVGDIRKREPDLVFLSEVSTRHVHQLRALFAAYPHVVLEPRHGYTGFALLSKWPVRDRRIVCRDDQGRRPVLSAEVDVQGRSVRVYGLHPHVPATPFQYRTREEQFSWLAEQIRGSRKPTVVMGDLNTTPYSPSFRRFVSNAGLRDNRIDHGWLPSWPAFLPFLWVPIDHILVNGAATVHAIERGPFIGSDHYPLIAEITVRG